MWSCLLKQPNTPGMSTASPPGSQKVRNETNRNVREKKVTLANVVKLCTFKKAQKVIKKNKKINKRSKQIKTLQTHSNIRY